MLITIAAEQRVAAPHDAVGRVRILSAESARKLSTKHLFLAGLSEQAFSGESTTETNVAESSQTIEAGLPADLVGQTQPNLHRSDALLLFYEMAF